MLIYLLFPALAAALDYSGYTYYKAKGGQFVTFWLFAIGVGVLIIGLPFIVATPVVTYPSQIITSATGNTTIQPYNITSTLSPGTEALALNLATALVFVQFGLSMLALLYIFLPRRNKRYET